MSQTEKIIAFLKSGRALDNYIAMNELGTYALSQRLGEIRKRYPGSLKSEWKETSGGARVKVWRWVGELNLFDSQSRRDAR